MAIVLAGLQYRRGHCVCLCMENTRKQYVCSSSFYCSVLGGIDFRVRGDDSNAALLSLLATITNNVKSAKCCAC